MNVHPSPPAQIPMDPRIRQRRIEVKRDAGLRRLRVLIAVLVVLLVTGGTWFAVRSSLLDVDHIEVEGAGRSTPAAVAAASGLRRGTAMIHLDETRMLAGVESLPWVRRASVRKEWPGTVVITVEERVARAVSRSDGGPWVLLDADGRVLAEAAEPPAGLMAIEGLGQLPEPGGHVATSGGPLAVLAALPPSLGARVAAIVAGDAGAIDLKLKPRGTVRFGPAADAPAKVRAIETVLASVDTHNLAVLDVRLPSSPVLTRG